MSVIEDLLEIVKRRGFVYRSEILEKLPEDIDDEEPIDDIVQYIVDLGIKVVEDSKD